MASLTAYEKQLIQDLGERKKEADRPALTVHGNNTVGLPATSNYNVHSQNIEQTIYECVPAVGCSLKG
jgi:hypothetical protein